MITRELVESWRREADTLLEQAAAARGDGDPRYAPLSGGCHIYIPAEELATAGIDPAGPPPAYRTWGTSRGGVMVRLYKEA